MSIEAENQKIQFLISAIADTQETIRFTDTKTAIVISILGAYVIGAFTSLEKIVRYCDRFHCSLWLTLFIFISTFLICVFITARIINPTKAPTRNITDSHLVEDLPFYVAPNKYDGIGFVFRNAESSKLSESYISYKAKITGATPEIIISSLSLELLKVSFVRNIKTDRFTHLVFWLCLTTVSFLIYYVLYLHSVQEITRQLELLKKHAHH